MDNYGVACSWSGRLEWDEHFIQRVAAWFRELSQIDPLLERWYVTGNTPKTAVEISPTVEVLRELFTRKPYKDEMGLSFLAWNGREGPDHCSTNMRKAWMAGGYPAICVVDPPWRGEFAERFLTVDVLTRVLRAMVRVWEPDWAGVTSVEYDRLIHGTKDQLPDVDCGWLTFLSQRRGEVPPLPEPVRVESVDDKGTLIILTPERFTVSNPAHVALALEAHRTLDQAGLLGPEQ